MTTPDQLSVIYDIYMIVKYENETDETDTLVYMGTTQDSDYNKWFYQTKPITPIYNSSEELNSLIVYDE